MIGLLRIVGGRSRQEAHRLTFKVLGLLRSLAINIKNSSDHGSRKYQHSQTDQHRAAMTVPTIFERRLRRGVLGVVCESIAYPCIRRWHGESVAPAEVEHTQAGRPFFGVVSVHSRGSQELKIS